MTNEATLHSVHAGNPRILIVDDERGPRESLRMILSSNYAVSVAENGAEALELLRTDTIDLVTVDLNMPGMKGDELMRTIRAEFPQTEIIIIPAVVRSKPPSKASVTVSSTTSPSPSTSSKSVPLLSAPSRDDKAARAWSPS